MGVIGHREFHFCWEMLKRQIILKKAATKERTFYGSLALASLGYKYTPNFDLPNYDHDFINKILKHKGGVRASIN